MANYRNNWIECKLSDILLSLESGKRPKGGVDHYDQGIPSLGGEHLSSDGRFNFSKIRFIPLEFLQKMTSGLIEHNDILVVKDGATTGRTSFVENQFPYQTAAINEHLFRLKIPRCVEAKWIFYQLWSQTGKKQILQDFRGAAQGGITKKFSEYVHVFLPPIAEQKRIVAKIEELFSEIDKGIENLLKAQELLKAYRQSILKNAFEGKLTEKWREKNSSLCHSLSQAIQKQELQKLPSLPPCWQYVPLAQFIKGIDAGKSFKCEEREPTSEEVGVAKVSAVTWGEYNESESKTCKDPNKINPKYYINEGDFLFSRANTIDLVGACVIVKRTQKTIMLSDKTLRIKFDFFDPLYFLLYLRSIYGRNEIMKRSTGNQDSMRNIGQEQIRNIIIPLCSKEEHLEIIKIVTEKLSVVENTETSICDEIKKAKILYQSILKKAFSGDLVSQDATDESASILLERIRAEKEIQRPPKKKSKQLQKVAV